MAYTQHPRINWADKVQAVEVESTSYENVNLNIRQIKDILDNVPEGRIRVRTDTIVDLTGNAAKFKNILTIPAGSIVQYVAANITELVVGGSTTVKVGIGPNGSSTNKYGHGAALTVNTKIQGLFNVVTPLAADEAVDVCGVVTAGTSLGDTNLTAGKVRVVIVYDKPAVLDSV